MASATNEPAPTSESASLGPDLSATYLAPFSIVIAIVIISTMARIYCRIYPRWRLGWDDYTLIFAFVSTGEASEHLQDIKLLAGKHMVHPRPIYELTTRGCRLSQLLGSL
jgi:hypothetical protein